MKRPMLLPLVPLYAAGLAFRELRLQRGWEPVRRLRYPVISIGNLSVGGSGKTPLTIALVRLLTARGVHVDVLSRGYGRSSTVPLRVDPGEAVDRYGDEPLLIARATSVPVYVASERFDAGKLAEAEFLTTQAPRVHVLDDGFQHRQLARDVDILLANREDWRDHLLPAGNLRESRNAARRASVIAIPADDRSFEAELRSWGWTEIVWRIRRRMEVPRIEGPVAAFCGIARPEQFFDGLRGAGVTLASQRAFPDHHRYTARDIDNLLSAARSAHAVAVVTTEKDAVRLAELGSAFPANLPLKTVGLAVDIEDESVVFDWLTARLTARPAPVSM